MILACPSCNHIKGSNIQFVNAYKINKNDIYFKAGTDSFKILRKQKAHNQCNILGLDSLYRIHQDEFLDLVNRNKLYTEEKKEEIGRILSRDNININWKNLVFGNIYTPDEYNQHPLSKFRNEIVSQLIRQDSRDLSNYIEEGE